MLDTVGIKHFYQSLMCDEFLRCWHYLSNKRNPTWTLNAKGSETLPKLTMIQTPNGIRHLSAEVSLPKMLFGHNARLPNQAEVIEGLQMISNYVESKSGLSFDIPTATVSLIHYTKDICLGEPEVLKIIKHSHKIILIFWHESLKFVSCALLNYPNPKLRLCRKVIETVLNFSFASGVSALFCQIKARA